MTGRTRDQASLEAKAARKLEQAGELERDGSGNWRARARRHRAANRLRDAAGRHQAAAYRMAGPDMVDDLPF